SMVILPIPIQKLIIMYIKLLSTCKFIYDLKKIDFCSTFANFDLKVFRVYKFSTCINYLLIEFNFKLILIGYIVIQTFIATDSDARKSTIIEPRTSFVFTGRRRAPRSAASSVCWAN